MPVQTSQGAVYLGRNNEADFVLLNDGVVWDTAEVSRVIVEAPELGVLVDSQSSSGSFLFPAVITYEGEEVNGISLLFGFEDLPVAVHRVRLVIYDEGHPRGLVWTNDMYLRVMPPATPQPIAITAGVDDLVLDEQASVVAVTP